MEAEKTQTLAGLASEAYDYFERAKRAGGEWYTRTKDDAPEWIGELVRAAHGGFLPDDWRYECIASALAQISDSDETATEYDFDEIQHAFADEHVDVYTAERLAWLSSDLQRMSYCDDAVSAGLIEPEADIATRIGVGQYMEACEVFASVGQSLVERLDA